MGRSRIPYRRIRTVPGPVDKRDYTELNRQIQEQIYEREGRAGTVENYDQVKIDAPERHTPLRLGAKGLRGKGAVSFSGRDNASMYIAKGAYMNDQGAWIAEDQVAVIFELNRDSETPQMFRNTELEVGHMFQPTPVGYIATGSSTGAPVVPGTTMVLPDPLTPMHPRPHTHLYPDVVGLDQAVAVLASPLQPAPPGPHTHLAEDVVNRAQPSDNDWILAGQIFGG